MSAVTFSVGDLDYITKLNTMASQVAQTEPLRDEVAQMKADIESTDYIVRGEQGIGLGQVPAETLTDLRVPPLSGMYQALETNLYGITEEGSPPYNLRILASPVEDINAGDGNIFTSYFIQRISGRNEGQRAWLASLVNGEVSYTELITKDNINLEVLKGNSPGDQILKGKAVTTGSIRFYRQINLPYVPSSITLSEGASFSIKGYGGATIASGITGIYLVGVTSYNEAIFQVDGLSGLNIADDYLLAVDTAISEITLNK